MTKGWITQIFLVFVFVLFGLGCDKKPDAPSENDVTNKSGLSVTVAEVDGEVILQSELDVMLHSPHAGPCSRTTTIPDESRRSTPGPEFWSRVFRCLGIRRKTSKRLRSPASTSTCWPATESCSDSGRARTDYRFRS